jgi:hypothetical protein
VTILENPILISLPVGLTINILDIACTLLFAAKPWEDELRRQERFFEA